MGFGFLTGLLSKNFTPKLLKVSGALIMILGILMLNRGMALTGSGVDFHTLIVRVSQQLFPLATQPPFFATEQTINMDVRKSAIRPINSPCIKASRLNG